MPRLANESLAEHLARLEREREDADRRYNDALTALDRALATLPEFPEAPPAYDASKLEGINAAWNTLPAGPPVTDGSLKGRLRAFIWRLVGPPIEAQRNFNAAIVDHLNRNVAAHAESARAARTTIELLRSQIEALVRFETHLIVYLQTLTLFVDSRDRLVAGGAEVVNAGLSAVTDEWLKRWESLGAREARLNGRVDAVLASLDDVRATSALAQQTSLSLKREVERVVSDPPAAAGGGDRPAVALPATADLNSFKYLGFENAFRGAPEEIRRRLEGYAPLFVGHRDVVDLGCGRGEFLDVLRAAGVSARGIDINAAMVEEARARGFVAEQGDALSHLRSLEADSIGGVFAAQVIEHLAPDYLTSMLEEAGRVIRPGGRIVLETINPTSWVAFFESYIRDITHVRPLHPETMQYLLRVSGFKDVTVRFSAPVDPDARLARAPEPAPGQFADLAAAVRVVNDNVERLNGRLFGDQDYAVLGLKA